MSYSLSYFSYTLDASSEPSLDDLKVVPHELSVAHRDLHSIVYGQGGIVLEWR